MAMKKYLREEEPFLNAPPFQCGILMDEEEENESGMIMVQEEKELSNTIKGYRK